MTFIFKTNPALPPDQEAIRARCFHSTDRYSELPYDEVKQTISGRFEKIALMVPNRVAVNTQGKILSHQGLNVSANRVARCLFSHQDDREEPVAEETCNKFLEDEADGDKRIYLSGDLGRLGTDRRLD